MDKGKGEMRVWEMEGCGEQGMGNGQAFQAKRAACAKARRQSAV